MEHNTVMGLGEAATAVFTDPAFIVSLLVLLIIIIISICHYYSGKAKDRKYSEEMTDSLYTLRYYRQDLPLFIFLAMMLITLSISLLVIFYTTAEDLSFDIGVLALYFMSLVMCGIPGIACAMRYVWKLKWKVVVSGDEITIYKWFSEPKKINFSDIVIAKKKTKVAIASSNAASRVYLYDVYVSNSASSIEKAFEVHKAINGFDRFEAQLISTQIPIQGVSKKDKALKVIAIGSVFFAAFIIPVAIVLNLGIFSLFHILFWSIGSPLLIKEAFSKFHFSKERVTRKFWIFRGISITWDSCAEIGIGKKGQQGLYDCIYFSKIPLTHEQINWMNAVKQSREHLWCECDDEVLAEVLKYVDRDKIKNLDLYESLALE